MFYVLIGSCSSHVNPSYLWIYVYTYFYLFVCLFIYLPNFIIDVFAKFYCKLYKSPWLALLHATTQGKEKIILTSVRIEPRTSGLDPPLLCRLSYEVGQRKVGDDLGGESRRRESKDTYECCAA